MINFIKGLFKKKQSLKYPNSTFGIIELNDVAKSKGIDDEFNKEIVIYSNGQEIKREPYSESHVNAWRRVYKIPIIERISLKDFQFSSYTNFGSVTLKR